jgi:uncharacterized protein YidB (DUF937 family)
MGVLESVASTVFKKDGASPDKQQGFLSSILAMIGSPDVGGLQGLVNKFKTAGLGQIADGWVAKGPNPPVTPDQLQKVFSSDQVRAFAEKVRIDPDDATKHLADTLPQVVDNLTPDGKVPAGGFDPAAALNLLKQKLFGS